MDPLPDHAALKLGKGANDLKDQLAGWRCGVNELPVDEKINPTVFEMLHSRQQIDQGAPQAIDRPGHYNVKSALAGVFEHLVEAGPVFAFLGPADAGIVEGCSDVSFERFGRKAPKWMFANGPKTQHRGPQLSKLPTIIVR